MSYSFYKILHLVSLFALFMSLAGLLYVNLFAKTEQKEVPKSIRIYLSILHGLSLLFVIVSGFGLAARLGLVQGLPNWVYLKIGIWLILGGSIALAKRLPHLARLWVPLWLALGVAAAYLAGVKPV